MLAIGIIISLFLLSPHLASPIRICQTLPQDSMCLSTPWHTAGCLLNAYCMPKWTNKPLDYGACRALCLSHRREGC